MGFRLVPKSVTLNDLERRNDRCFALFQGTRVYDEVAKQLQCTSVSKSTFNSL